MEMYLSKIGKDAWVALLAVCSVGLADKLINNYTFTPFYYLIDKRFGFSV